MEYDEHDFKFSSTLAPVQDLKLVASIGREQSGDVAQALRQRRCRQQRIFALPQVVVVEVDRERQHVDSERIGE